jgi:Bacterial Ig domain/SdrD B-like domain
VKFLGLLALVLGFSVITAPSLAQVIPSPGKDGVGGTLTGVVNTYYPGLGQVNAGSTSLQLGTRNTNGSSSPIRAGDLILIMQMQGATIDFNDDDRYGDGLSGNPASGSVSANAGQYEFAKAFSDLTVGGQLELRGAGTGDGLLFSYTDSNPTASQGAVRYQVIRVPQFSSATLGNGLTAAAWNGSSGGVLALDIAGTATLAGTVDVSGKGFRGAGGRLLNGAIGPLGEPIEYRVNAATGTDNDGGKGEGIAGTPRFVNQNGSLLDLGTEGYPLGSAGFGAPGNAGGGGTNATGGGGGSNGGAGGRGGDNWSPTETTASQRHPDPLGGFGGTRDTNSSSRLLLGGGGGAGANRNFLGAHGGAGGGIVIVRAARVLGSGTILADGADGISLNQTGSVGNVGGGGAGGSVLIATTNTAVFSGWSISAVGGAGGSIGGGSTVHAAGGGGGGGKIFLSSSANAANAGGARGISPAENDANNGGSGAIPVTHLPGAGQAGTVPSYSINATRDVPGIPPGAAVVPLLTVTKRALVSSLEAGGSMQYEIEVVNATGRAPASGVALRDDALPNGFLFSRLEAVTLELGATGPSTPEVSGANNAPSFGVAGDAIRGFMIPALGKVTVRFSVTVNPTTLAGTYQNPASASYLDPARTLETGLTSTSYDTNLPLEDVTVITYAAPTAQADRANTTSDTSVLIDVLGNDSNPAGGALQIDLDPVANGLQAQVSVAGRGVFLVETDKVRFTPEAGFSGDTTIEYTIINRLGTTSNRAAIVVTVNSSVPTAVDDTSETTSDAAVLIPILQNDRNPVPGALEIDLDPDTAGIQTNRVLPGGTFEVQNSTVRFTPISTTSGTISLQYVILNAAGYSSNRATIRVVVRRVTASLSGNVFQDLNGDGLRQPNEPGFADVALEITDSTGIHPVRTDALGNYQLEIRPGTVRVRVTTPNGWVSTTAINVILTAPVGDTTGIDFGFSQPQLRLELQVPNGRVQVGQTLLFEARLIQVSPASLRNVSLRLRLPQGFVYHADPSATLNPVQRYQGGMLTLEYTAASIPTGQSFVVRGFVVVSPTALRNTAMTWQLEGGATVGSLDAPQSLLASSISQPISVAGDPTGSLVGRVYQDVDSNNRFSSGDQPIQNARVLLSNGLVATTDIEGRYGFASLEPGRYLLQIQNLINSPIIAVVIDPLGTSLQDVVLSNITDTNTSNPIRTTLGQFEASAGYSTTGFSAAIGMRGVVIGTFSVPQLGDLQITAVVNGTIGFDQNGLRFQSNALRNPALTDLTATAGSNSTLGISDDGFYLRVQAVNWQLTYGRVNIPTSNAFSSGATQQGLRFDWQNTNTQASASLSAINSRSSNQNTSKPYGFAGTGSTRYMLEITSSGIVPGSEIITILTRDARNLTLKAKPDRILQRDADYRFDPDTGLVILFAPLNTTDVDGNPQFLVVTYASSDANFQVLGAVGAETKVDAFTVRGSVYRFSSDTAPLVSLGGSYESGDWRASLELGWANDFVGQGTLEYRNPFGNFSLQYRQLGQFFVGPQPETPGLNILATGTLNLKTLLGDLAPTLKIPSDDLKLEASVSQRTPYSNLEKPSTTIGTEVAARFGSHTALLGGVIRLADQSSNPGGFIALGYRGSLNALEINIEQLVPLTRLTNGETTFSLRYAIEPQTRLLLRGTLVYAPQWRGTLWFGIENDSQTETTNAQYRAGISLPNANGETINAVLAVSARWVIGQNLSFDAAAQGSLTQPSFNLNLGAVYSGTIWRGSARLETTISANPQASLSVNAAITPISDIVVTPNIRVQLETGAIQFGINAALRQTDWVILTDHSLTLDPNQPWRNGARGQISAGWNPRSDIAVRVGLNYRFENAIFTTLFSVGTNTRLTALYSLGARVLIEWQPSTNTSRFAFGVEVGYELGSGARLIGGINTTGFSSPWEANTAPGLYVRLEYRLDALFALFADNSPQIIPDIP